MLFLEGKIWKFLCVRCRYSDPQGLSLNHLYPCHGGTCPLKDVQGQNSTGPDGIAHSGRKNLKYWIYWNSQNGSLFCVSGFNEASERAPWHTKKSMLCLYWNALFPWFSTYLKFCLENWPQNYSYPFEKQIQRKPQGNPFIYQFKTSQKFRTFSNHGQPNF